MLADSGKSAYRVRSEVIAQGQNGAIDPGCVTQPGPDSEMGWLLLSLSSSLFGGPDFTDMMRSVLNILGVSERPGLDRRPVRSALLVW